MPQKNDASQSESTATGKTDEDNLANSGYGSQQSTQAATMSGSEERGIELRISKSKTIRHFSGRLNEAHIEHFHIIRPSVEKLLVRYVTRKSFLRGSMPYKPMVVRPMLLGNTLLDARPHIVVFCAPDMRKRIQGFLDTDRLIKACCKDDSRRGFSKFGITVCGCAPKLRTDDFSTDCQRNELAEKYRGKSEDTYQSSNSKDQKPKLPVTINTARRYSTRYVSYGQDYLLLSPILFFSSAKYRYVQVPVYGMPKMSLSDRRVPGFPGVYPKLIIAGK